MFFSILLVLIATAGGTLLNYLYDEDAPLAARLCTGACTGFALFALLAFLFASALGLNQTTLALSALALLAPLALLTRPKIKDRVREDFSYLLTGVKRAILRPSGRSTVYFIFYALLSVILWLAFDRAMIERDGGIYTGYVNNLGDLPFHLQAIQSFARSANFPPEDPTYAGARFAYPFMADFLSACLVKAGATLRQAIFIVNFVLAIALAGVLNRWTLKLTRERIAGLIAPALVFLSGGLGWLLLFADVRKNEGGLFSLLTNLQHDYTIMGAGGWRWGNSITTLLITQRSILFGLPLAVTIFTQWWLANKKEGEEREEGNGGKGKGKKKKIKIEGQQEAVTSNSLSPFPLLPFSTSGRRMLAAGLMAGVLPLVHAHSFIVVMGTGGLTALILFLVEKERAARMNLVRDWGLFFASALIIAVPEMWFATHGSSAKAGMFLGWEFGWDHGDENVHWFWLKNTGLVIPLIFTAVLWREEKYLVRKRMLLFYLPFTLCFIAPNMMKMAPWVWDNIKVLFYWFVASVPLISLLLAHLWRKGAFPRAISIVLFIALTLAGALDVWRVISGTTEFQEYDANGVAIARKILEVTPERALVLHAPTYNPPVFLTGRRSLLGYTGYIWAHGLDYSARETDIKSIYAGGAGAEEALARNHVDYILVGPHERSYMPVNDAFLARFQKVGEAGEYSLYKVARR
ncbi:MAG TPA: hypothetical protein VK619_00925 [Pyrinomonadaceae bacterium]|nr:hypothetical protein [Pyrinomonadaceae bacterium]